jgi:hypothetical protein
LKKKTIAVLAVIASLLLFFLAIGISPIYAQTPTQTPNYSDYVPTPNVPEFTMTFLQSEYNVTVTDPYTGVNTTQQVNNNSIEITIRNQPFSPYTYLFSYRGISSSTVTSLWYNIQAKGHYSQDWADVAGTIYPSPSSTQSNLSDYTVISAPNPIAYPEGGLVDFRVRAMAGGWFPDANYFARYLVSKNSSWSPTQTITIPATLPTPSPSIPEFPLTALTISFLTITILFRILFKRKQLRDRIN